MLESHASSADEKPSIWSQISSSISTTLSTRMASRFVAKIAAYMRVPRSTVIRRLDRLQRWGLIYRQGRRYYLHDKALNSFIGVRSYQASRRLLSRATEELTILGTLPD